MTTLNFDEFFNMFNFGNQSRRPTVPEKIIEADFTDVQEELYKNKLISSNNIFNRIFNRAKIYQFESGEKFWEPKFEDFKKRIDLY